MTAAFDLETGTIRVLLFKDTNVLSFVETNATPDRSVCGVERQR